MSIREIELYRDSSSTPWGFRMVGGKDLRQALHVQKISLCSPSHGELEAGDLLLKIQGQECTNLTHVFAQDLIRKAGGSLNLIIKRCGPSQHPNFRPQSWHCQGSYMMQRLQDTLAGAVTNKCSQPISMDSARSKLADWLYQHGSPPKASPLNSPPEFGWSPKKTFSPGNDVGTCFIPPNFSSKASLKLTGGQNSNNQNSVGYSSHISSPSQSIPSSNHFPWTKNDHVSEISSVTAEEGRTSSQQGANHQHFGIIHHFPSSSKSPPKHYNSPSGLYAEFKPMSPIKTTFQHVESQQRNLKPREEVLYQFRIDPREKATAS